MSNDILLAEQKFRRHLVVFQNALSVNHSTAMLHESNPFEIYPDNLEGEAIIHLEKPVASLFSFFWW
jgi:hypothetical protein